MCMIVRVREFVCVVFVVYTHAHTHTPTNTDICTHTHTKTQTHTHTHGCIPRQTLTYWMHLHVYILLVCKTQRVETPRTEG
jgi:hypothetical protein